MRPILAILALLALAPVADAGVHRFAVAGPKPKPLARRPGAIGGNVVLNRVARPPHRKK